MVCSFVKHSGAMLSSSTQIPNCSVPTTMNHDGLHHPLSQFDLHGYHPSPNLSDDENYMDIVMIMTRSSMLRQGSMGCILVRQRRDDEQEQSSDLLERIIAASTNTSIFKSGDSDIHAEINVIGQVAKQQQLHLLQQSTPNSMQKATTPINDNSIISTQDSTAYITMPPCNKCFGALYASGIKRIVSRKQYRTALLDASTKLGIEMVCLTKQEVDDQRLRLDQLFYNAGLEGNVLDQEAVRIRRKQRKEDKHTRKKMKKIVAKGSNIGNTDDKVWMAVSNVSLV